MSAYGWRVYPAPHVGTFARDQVGLWILNRTPDGSRLVAPTTLEPGDVLPEGETNDVPPSLTIDLDLAAALVDGLAPITIGLRDGDLVGYVKRLERERDKAVSQLDALIAGLGRMGGVVIDGRR